MWPHPILVNSRLQFNESLADSYVTKLEKHWSFGSQSMYRGMVKCRCLNHTSRVSVLVGLGWGKKPVFLAGSLVILMLWVGGIAV